MSFIQRELDRIGNALQRSDPVPQRDELYAAQQALIWATDPSWYKSPFDMLASNIRTDSADCLVGSDHSPS
jgi:hypothetical protein